MSSAKIRIAHLGQLVDSLLGSDDVPSTGDVDEVCSVISISFAVPYFMS